MLRHAILTASCSRPFPRLRHTPMRPVRCVRRQLCRIAHSAHGRTGRLADHRATILAGRPTGRDLVGVDATDYQMAPLQHQRAALDVNHHPIVVLL